MIATGRRLVAASLVALVTGLAPVAAEEDVLVGVKVKDGTPPANSTHAYTSGTAPGWAGNCELKKPQFHLVRAEQDGGDDPNGGEAVEYVCYKAKCDTGPPATYPDVEDARGTHALEGKKNKLICLPKVDAGCGNGIIDAGEDCDGLALGSCLAGCEPDCTCTPPPPCPGFEDAGVCWVLSGPEGDCLDACSDAMRSYSTLTESYAGSGGSNAACTAILNALGYPGGAGAVTCAAGVGCGHLNSFPFDENRRCTSPPTASGSTLTDFDRACGCE